MLEQYLWFVKINWLTIIISLIIAMIVLNYATWILEKEISTIWKKLKIPTTVRWAIFDASMSSLPELLTSFAWLIILGSKWLEVWTWTIWWSALFNILIIPAAVLLAYNWKKPIKINKWWIKRDSIFYILSIIIIILWLWSKQLTFMSLSLIWLYVIYMFYLYKQSLQHRKENKKEVELAYESVKNVKISYIKIILSLIIVYVWVEASVVAAEWIWNVLHISILIISLVILASITSIPDTLLSIKSTKKWDVDAGFSNAVWSNIFDICIWLGLPIFIWTVFMWLKSEIDFEKNFYMFIFVILATIIYFVVINLRNISKKNAYMLILAYILIVIYLVIW